MDKSLSSKDLLAIQKKYGPNSTTLPYNHWVNRIVEDGKKFEIKFAEKKKKDGFIHQLADKFP